MNKILLALLFFQTTVFPFEVFEPNSRPVPKKQIYYFSASKIFFYTHFISARYGKKFEDPKIQAEFDEQKWYKVNPNYKDSLLNSTDRSNIKNLQTIYNSIVSKTKEVKSLKGELTWSKKVNFIDDNRKETLIYKVQKNIDGYTITITCSDNGKIFYKETYDLKKEMFADYTDRHGYPFDGIYETIASNFEFIDIEFFPDSRTELSVVYWLKENKNLSAEKAQAEFENLVPIISKHKGRALYKGDKGGGLFPKEYIYLNKEKAFVEVYAP